MRAEPPPGLVELLQQTGLATPDRVRGVARSARRMAGDLPLLESVWVDALARARVLTPLQAAEIHAGRGRRLRVGPFLLAEALPWPEYAPSFRARRVDSGEPVRLAVIDVPAERREAVLAQLQSLADASRRLHCRQLAPIVEAGADADRIWAAARWTPGRSANEWMLGHGRMAPEAVVRVAREMLVAVESLRQAGMCHGDIGAGGLILTAEGGLKLLWPGLRAILRPAEGYAQADLRPDAYDYLAPERVASGVPPDMASDLYACGCTWWQLLCGRPPLVGGDSLTKLRSAGAGLRSAGAGRIPDVRTVAPDAPPELAEAVNACLEPDPGRRPESPPLRQRLGAADRGGQSALVRCLANHRGPSDGVGKPLRVMRRAVRNPGWPMAAAVAVVAVVGAWSLWRDARPRSMSAGQTAVAQAHRETPDQWNDSLESARPLAPAGVAPGAGEALPERTLAESIPAAVGAEGVLPAGYDVPSSGPPEGEQIEAAVSQPDRVLRGDNPVSLDPLELRSGQRVCGPPDGMAVVRVPPGGLAIGQECMRFERIEFVGEGDGERGAALIELRATRADFRQCVFRVEAGGASTAAVRWVEPPNALASDMALPSGRLRFVDSAVYGLGSAVDCRTTGALAIECSNLLHLASGPLVRINHCPAPDEPMRLWLEKVTLRASGPLLQCRYEQVGKAAGEMTVVAKGCVLAPPSGTALLQFDGPRLPEDLLRRFRWSGQGSLVVSTAPVATWQGPDRRKQVLDDSGFSISGLVRSRVEFAGGMSRQAADSRATWWQLPLATPDPPGIDAGALLSPR